MKRTIIVTDLTRFANQKIVCTAGIDMATSDCIRPMPYISSSECKRLKILPGAILTSDFTPTRNLSGPHREDHDYKKLEFEGPCTSKQFKDVLVKSCWSSVEDGFEIHLAKDQKLLPADHSGQRSIITIAVAPSDVEIVEDNFKPGKIKIHFRDRSRRSFRFIGVTDLGFHDYALQHHARNELAALNEFIHAQQEVFLRIGLSRLYTAPDGRRGYWMQVNGIYTFPDYHEGIRSHSQ